MASTILVEETSLINPGEVWSEIHQDIILDSRGTIKRVINEAAVVASIDNILRTSVYERVMLPGFGAGIDQLLFEPISQSLATEMSTKIRENLNRWDDRVIVNSIDFTSKPDSNFIGLNMVFSIIGYENIFEFQMDIPVGD